MVLDGRAGRCAKRNLAVKSERINEFYLAFRDGVPGGIFASEAMRIEKNAVGELDTILALEKCYAGLFERNPEFFGGDAPAFTGLSISPDFHKGSGVPIGTTLRTDNVCIPALMGGDIGCGMLFIHTDIPSGEVAKIRKDLMRELRRIFFEGARDLPLFADEVKELFARGLSALAGQLRERHGGSLWARLADISGVSWQTADFAGAVFGQLADFSGVSRSAHLGSIGGGNHFVEIQSIDRIFEHTPIRKGCLGVMVHSGSLSLGKAAGMYLHDRLRAIYPAGEAKPPGSFYPLPLSEKSEHYRFACALLGLVRNVLNFASANRVVLGLMVEEAFSRCGVRGRFVILHDAAHNVMGPYDDGVETTMVHRKGSTPAELMQPVIIPGSMGTASYILRGFGSEQGLRSAAHGAGRAVSRQNTMRGGDDGFEDFFARNTVVAPVDFQQLRIAKRWDILKEKTRELRQEAPAAYKDIEETIRVTEGAGIAGRVARLSPLLTVKQI